MGFQLKQEKAPGESTHPYCLFKLKEKWREHNHHGSGQIIILNNKQEAWKLQDFVRKQSAGDEGFSPLRAQSHLSFTHHSKESLLLSRGMASTSRERPSNRLNNESFRLLS